LKKMMRSGCRWPPCLIGRWQRWRCRTAPLLRQRGHNWPVGQFVCANKVQLIIDNVKSQGDKALLRFVAQFDG
jgi:hypothetical protein